MAQAVVLAIVDWEQIIAALIIAGVPAVVTIVTARRAKRRERTETGGAIADLHRDVELLLKPTVKEVHEFMHGYDGTPWSDAEAIDKWLIANDERFDRLDESLRDHIHEQVIQFKGIDERLDALHKLLDEHDQWERRVLGPDDEPG